MSLEYTFTFWFSSLQFVLLITVLVWLQHNLCWWDCNERSDEVRLLSSFFIWKRKSWYQQFHTLSHNFKNRQSTNSWNKLIYLLRKLPISSCIYFWNRKFAWSSSFWISASSHCLHRSQVVTLESHLKVLLTSQAPL